MVHAMLRKHGVLAQVTGARSPVLKLLPPMIIDEEDVAQIADAVSASLDELRDGAFIDSLGRAIGSMPGQALRRAAHALERATS
jgi:hypothetical protein